MMEKFTMKQTPFRYSGAFAMALSALSLVVSMSQHTLGYLIGTLGLSHQFAVLVVTVILSGGIYTAAILYPFLVPVIATIQGLLFIAGAAAVIGF